MLCPTARFPRQRRLHAVGAVRRRGLSLLEVLLAIAILGGSLTVLGQLVQIGSRSAVSVRDLTQGQLLCENKLAEISAGVLLPEPVVQEPLEETGEWLFSVDVQAVDDLGLLAVTVLVEQDPEQIARPARISLTRWMVDPAVDAAAAEQQAAADEAAKTAAEGNSASGGSASGNGGAGGSGNSGGGQSGSGNQRPGGGNQGSGSGTPGNVPAEAIEDLIGGGSNGR